MNKFTVFIVCIGISHELRSHSLHANHTLWDVVCYSWVCSLIISFLAGGLFWQKMVFVTAASDNHYLESQDAIASVQKFFPGYKIIYYDLGLKTSHVKEVYRSLSYGAISKKTIILHHPGHLHKTYRGLLTISEKP